MQNFDLHVHSTFSDGSDEPEDIVRTAIDLGLSCIGFSDHSYLKEAEEWCMREDSIPLYRKTISQIKEKYRDKIKVLCGIEQDFHSSQRPVGFDYVIGSVHFIEHEGNLAPVDESPSILSEIADTWFDGDFYALCNQYYQEVSMVIQKTGADIIGHLDLITKFNEQNRMFSESEPRYILSSQTATSALLPSKKPFEINFGAISRGYRTSPYPTFALQRYIAEHGGTFILSSDSHAKETLCFGFSSWTEPLQKE